MSLTVEEIQKTLTESMMSMQSQMEIERKGYKEKIKSLKDIIDEKDEIISELSKKQAKDAAVRTLEQEIERLRNETDSKTVELKSSMINVSTLKNQIELEKQNSMQLNMEKKKLQEQLSEISKVNNLKNSESDTLKQQIDILNEGNNGNINDNVILPISLHPNNDNIFMFSKNKINYIKITCKNEMELLPIDENILKFNKNR